MRVLDIDLDFFLSDCCPLAEPGERPCLTGHEPWEASAVQRFLEEHCGLDAAHPIPGRVFETHDKALVWWEELIKAGRLTAPFEVTHIDAHSDLGIGYPGPGYVLYNVISRAMEKRMDLQAFYDDHKLDEANYLLFALAMRRISALDNVRRPFSKPDIPKEILKDGDPGTIQLVSLTSRMFEKQNGPEPEIPFLSVTEPEKFCAEASYDFVSLAISPRYAPVEADALVPVFERYMILE